MDENAGSGARGSKYEQAEVRIESEDVLVLYTDGVTEGRNGSGEEFGDTRLVEAVRGGAGGSAAETLEAVMRAVAEFAGDAPQHDDITLIVARAV